MIFIFGISGWYDILIEGVGVLMMRAGMGI
jgi:hypothetical protein